MKLSEILAPERVLLRFEAADKWQAIAAMADAIAASGALPDGLLAVAKEALLARERSMTTGMEHGVAIPHAALDGIVQVLGALAVSPDGIPYDTLDGKPGRILVCLLIPRAEKLGHIRTLAEIAKLLSRNDVRRKIRRSDTAEQVLEALRDGE